MGLNGIENEQSKESVQVACLHCPYHNHGAYTNLDMPVVTCPKCGLPICQHCVEANGSYCPHEDEWMLPNGTRFLCNEGKSKQDA